MRAFIYVLHPTLERPSPLTQDSLRQMTDGIAQLQETVDSLPGTIADAQARITEIDTELQNIKTRQATLAAMRPQLEEQLKAMGQLLSSWKAAS